MSKPLLAEAYIQAKLPELKARCQKLCQAGTRPKMVAVLVGNSPASLVYIKHKQKKCLEIGADFELVHLEESIPEKAFLDKLKAINQDPKLTGAIVQLPLPKHLAHLDSSRFIVPEKDIDGFHPNNLYRLLAGKHDDSSLQPCTPKGLIQLLQHYGYELSGKNVVVIGRSMIVGKPTALLATAHDATVTLCHSQTSQSALKQYCAQADIIVVAVGSRHFFTPDFLDGKHKPAVIDVGIHSHEGKLAGDCAPLGDKVSAYSPVPGGVGPMTVISLIENLLIATENQTSQR